MKFTQMSVTETNSNYTHSLKLNLYLFTKRIISFSQHKSPLPFHIPVIFLQKKSYDDSYSLQLYKKLPSTFMKSFIIFLRISSSCIVFYI